MSTARGRPKRRVTTPPCPQCESEQGLANALGNGRRNCPLCNRFAQRVRREVLAELIQTQPEEFARIQRAIEEALAPGYIKDYEKRARVLAAGKSVQHGKR